MRFRSPRGPVAVALFAAVLVAGCGRPVGSVTGTVTYQGKTLKGGGVTFVSTEGGRSFAATITAEGTYTVPDIVGGDYKVCVDTSSLKGATTTTTSIPGAAAHAQPVVPKGAKTAPPPGVAMPEGYGASDPNAMKSNAAAKRYVAIPPKYADVNATDLTYTFKGGAETFNIELK